MRRAFRGEGLRHVIRIAASSRPASRGGLRTSALEGLEGAQVAGHGGGARGGKDGGELHSWSGWGDVRGARGCDRVGEGLVANDAVVVVDVVSGLCPD